MSAPKAPTPGIYTPTITFYKKDGFTLDLDAQIKHAKYLHDNGIEGVILFGSTGENAHLSQKERVAVVKAIHEAVPGLTIMSGISKNCLEEALEEIALVKEAGSQYALTLPSSYYGAGTYQEGIISWYKTVADKSVLPVLVYVYPGVCNGLTMTMDTIKTLSAHPNIVGTKFSYNDVADYTVIAGDKEVAANNFHFFSGLGQLLTTVLLVGGKGVIDGLSNAVPKVYVKIFKLVQEGKIAEATELQHKVTKVEVLLNNDTIVNIKKAVQQYPGIGEYSFGRAPLCVDSPASKSEPFLTAFKGLVELEKSL